LLHLLTAGYGPGLPALAVTQVVGYLGYTGGHGNAAAMAAHDVVDGARSRHRSAVE